MWGCENCHGYQDPLCCQERVYFLSRQLVELLGSHFKLRVRLAAIGSKLGTMLQYTLNNPKNDFRCLTIRRFSNCILRPNLRRKLQSTWAYQKSKNSVFSLYRAGTCSGSTGRGLCATVTTLCKRVWHGFLVLVKIWCSNPNSSWKVSYVW